MLKILFMGTPDFAIPTLEALCNSEDEVIGVITQTDKPKGRGYTLTPPPVKVFAAEHSIPVYQPKTLRSEESVSLISELAPDLIVVVAYGKILPPEVLNIPRFKCINVHGSLLPKYRGAAPMQRAIIDGEKVTGVTTMYMAEGLDTGDMLLSSEIKIEENDNFESIHDKLANEGAKLLIKTVEELKKGTLIAKKQDDAKSTYAAKIEKSDCLIDFSLDVRTVHNLIRGLSPIPLSFTHTPDGKLLKIISSTISNKTKPDGAKCGEVTELDTANSSICVACADGIIELHSVLPEGKSKMSAADFIRGRKISVGDILS